MMLSFANLGLNALNKIKQRQLLCMLYLVAGVSRLRLAFGMQTDVVDCRLVLDWAVLDDINFLPTDYQWFLLFNK